MCPSKGFPLISISFTGFDSLLFLGKETAGAIVISKEEQLPEEDNIVLDKTDYIRNFLRDHKGFLAIALGSRLSLAGAQDKLPVIYKDNRFFLPKNYMPTTHILKPDSLIYPNLVYNEYFCLNLARSLGLNVSQAEIIELERPVLCLTRYDRNNGQRLHQEDFCQAMNIPAESKYQNSGYYYGVTSIIETAEKIGLDIRYDILDFMLYNFLIGNMDGHAKNLSLLYQRDGSVSLAPFYDFVCTEYYTELDTKFSMAFGNHYEKKEVDANDLKILAEDLKINQKDVIDRLEYYITEMPKIINGFEEFNA